MKRLFASLAIVLTAFNGQAYAFTGGPFDNGFQSNQLNNNSIYQATLSFVNGSGFCYFNPTTAIVGDLAGNTAGVSNRGAIANRLVLYYKGLSYVGSTFGTDDIEARLVNASFNGTTDLTFQVTQAQATATLFTASSSSTSAATTVVASNHSYIVNGNFTGKIYQTAPTLRFRGTGQVSFMAPTGTDSVSGLAYSGYSSLISAIVNAVSNANVGQNFNPATFSTAQTAIDSALSRTQFWLTGSGIDSTFAGQQVHALSVRGTRRYL